jgi:transcription initiation factor TFIIE subunit alpha
MFNYTLQVELGKMTLTNEKLYKTVSELVGEDVIPLVKFLRNRKNISEFKIAEKINVEVNQTRNMLYRLHDHNLVTYHRKKDRVKGWYISYWTFNAKRLKQLVGLLKKQKLSQLKEKLQKEEQNQNSFFICPNICVRLDFDQAADFEFKCPECGSLLAQQDNTKTIDNLKEKIKVLEAA